MTKIEHTIYTNPADETTCSILYYKKLSQNYKKLKLFHTGLSARLVRKNLLMTSYKTYTSSKIHTEFKTSCFCFCAKVSMSHQL